MQDVGGKFTGDEETQQSLQYGQDPVFAGKNISCQILRSAAKWSHGHALEVIEEYGLVEFD